MRNLPEVEDWRIVADWPDYAVSSLGRIKRITSFGRGLAGSIRKPILTPRTGYLMVTLTNRDGRRKMMSVHGLVAEAFLGPRPSPDMEVNHLDADRANPAVSNLEWATRSRNRKHGYDVGFADASGEANGYSKLNDDAVRDIRATGGPGRWDILAEKHDVSAATVRDVFARRTWKHL